MPYWYKQPAHHHPPQSYRSICQYPPLLLRKSTELKRCASLIFLYLSTLQASKCFMQLARRCNQHKHKSYHHAAQFPPYRHQSIRAQAFDINTLFHFAFKNSFARKQQPSEPLGTKLPPHLVEVRFYIGNGTRIVSGTFHINKHAMLPLPS